MLQTVSRLRLIQPPWDMAKVAVISKVLHYSAGFVEYNVKWDLKK